MLIAGAGLAGLLLAGDLATAGLPVTVLGPDPDEARSGQVTVGPRTLEQLDARGLAQALVAAGLTLRQVPLRGDISLDLSSLPSRYPFALISPGHEASELLATRARSAGATFFPGTRVTGVSQRSDHVLAEAVDALGTPCAFGAWYLVRAYSAANTWLAGRLFGVGAGPGTDIRLQDAANLSWKLIAVLRDGADPDLLASYAIERAHAIRYAARRAAWLARLGPGGIRAGLRIAPVAGYAARAVSGLALSYPREAGRHRLDGRRAQDRVLADGTGRRLYEALREQRPVVLASPELLAGTDLPSLLDLWAGRVLASSPSGPASLMLIRPDGYVGWASDSASPVMRYAGLREALGRCCGSPAARHASRFTR